MLCFMCHCRIMRILMSCTNAPNVLYCDIDLHTELEN